MIKYTHSSSQRFDEKEFKMTLCEIIDNGGYEERILELPIGEAIARAARRFEIGAWERETGDQVGVSFRLLAAIAGGNSFDRLVAAGRVSRRRRHAWADAQTIINA
jgi:hypothetical protein